jgi:tRNA threonylcarbamoyladenosine biosynthesis protein TsaB
MDKESFKQVLLIDTCGQFTGVCFCLDETIRYQLKIPNRELSANVLAAIQKGLRHISWSPHELTAIGVVAGPGSFTSVRVGISVAQGMNEALGIPVMVVSRLQILSRIAGMSDGLAILDAGRGEFFVREEPDGKESLQPLKSLEAMLASRVIVVAEAQTAKQLGLSSAVLYELSASDALRVMIEMYYSGRVESQITPNYVSLESDIYTPTHMRLHDVG